MSLEMSDSMLVHVTLCTALCLFVIGFLGVLLRRNLLIVFMCIELMLNAANMVFVAFSSVYQVLDAQIAVVFSMTIAAAEAAVGLSILILLYRKTENIFTDQHFELKG